MGSHYVYKVFRKIKIVKYCKRCFFSSLKTADSCPVLTREEGELFTKICLKNSQFLLRSA